MRVRGLVAGREDDAFDVVLERGVYEVLRAEHVGLDRFERVVLARAHVFHGGEVEDDVDFFHGARKAFLVLDVADQEAH